VATAIDAETEALLLPVIDKAATVDTAGAGVIDEAK
jgi:hypothetical protein